MEIGQCSKLRCRTGSQSLPKKFNNGISDECGDHSNGKIDFGEYIFNSPTKPFPSAIPECVNSPIRRFE